MAVSTLALIGIAPIAQAQTYTFFPSDTTIDYDVITDYSVVGYASRVGSNFQTPSSPTVNLVTGGILRGNGLSYTYNSSTLNVSGGKIYSGLYANNSSTLNLSGGTVSNLYTFNSSMANVSGGSVDGDILAYDSSTVNISGGRVNDLFAFDSNTVNVSGGYVSYNLYASGSSLLNMGGGTVGDLYPTSFGTVNLSGGTVQRSLNANMFSTVNVSGGSVDGNLYAHDSSLLNFFGHGLVASLIDPNPGGLSRYSLSGTLLDGTVWTNKNLYIANGKGARFTLNNVPAPGSLVTALIGVVPGVMLLRRRRKAVR